jgi:tetratricopeptide (TPR) repeat protein
MTALEPLQVRDFRRPQMKSFEEMNLKKLFFLFTILVSFPLYATQSIVILPFSDESKNQQVYWLGEGFAESLSEEMFLKGAYIIQRPERKAAFDALKLPYVGHVSRATMLKIGNNLDANYIVFGSYALEGENLKVEARVIQTSSSRLSNPIQASGTLSNLYQIQGNLKKSLQEYFASVHLEPAEIKQEASSIPLHAYELYIKGLLETSDQEKVKFFERAMEADPTYSQANYRLALAYFRLALYEESDKTLSKISGNGMMRSRVDFLSGLNSYFTRNFEKAAEKWYALSQTSPTAEIYNNIGVALIRENQLKNAISYLTRAIELDADHPDFRFNLGIAYFQSGLHADAARLFRDSIDLRPGDYQAFYWLYKSLENTAESPSQLVHAMFQERLPDDQKGKFPEQSTDILRLLRPSLTYLANQEKDYAIATRLKSIKQRMDYVKTYQESAKRYLDGRQPDRAILDIKKGITFSPFDWYLHNLWAQALLNQGQQPSAVQQLQFSLWCMSNIDSHILLVEIYSQTGQYTAAKKHIQEILALDPKHKRAIEIWGKIHNKT